MKKNIITKFIAIFSASCCIVSFAITGVNAAVVNSNELSTSYILNDAELSAENSLPSKYSSKDLGYVTEVKNQLFNDCWAYAGLAAFESKLLHDGIDIGNMSVNHLNAWATTNSNGRGWTRNTSDEGYSYICPGYLISWQGGVEEKDAGYIDLEGNIMGDNVQPDLTKYGTTSIRYLDKEDTNQIKQAIIDNGGVCTSYSNATVCFSKDNLSYYMPASYEGNYIGHSVEAVGWDDNYSKSNFDSIYGETPENDGAWLVKNSWGSYNSLEGYFWISYEDAYIFNDKYKPSYTIESYQKITDNVRLEQNEIFGATYDFNYIRESDITYINKFDFSNGYNTLDKVIFETSCKGADYSIYYIPVNEDEPESDEGKWTRLYNGTVDYKGYICADLDDFELPVGYGAIAVRIDTSVLNEGVSKDSDEYVSGSIGVGEWLTKTDGTYIFKNDSKSKNSYIYYDDQMSELLDWYKTNLNDEMGGTFVIKAITTNDGPKATFIGDANLDGKIDVSDATAIQKYIAKLLDFTEISKINADVDKNGIIDVNDVTLIQKYIVKLFYEF